MSHYSLLFDEIQARVLAAYTRADYVFDGRANRYTAQLPRLTLILDGVDRLNVGRSVEQTWNWTIGAEVELRTDDSAPQDQAAELAELIINELCPFSTNGTPPTPPSPFAGVGFQPACAHWEWVPTEAEDNNVTVMVNFIVRTTVWQ